jgi:hypothetical protein
MPPGRGSARSRASDAHDERLRNIGEEGQSDEQREQLEDPVSCFEGIRRRN